MKMTKTVVTGMGTINPLGLNVGEFWSGLIAGRSGIAPISRFDASKFYVKVDAEVRGFDPAKYMDLKAVDRNTRAAHFAIAAANSLISSVLILLLKETKSDDSTQKRPQMRVAFQDKSFMKFVIIYALFGLSMSFVWPINPIIQVNYLGMEFYQIAILSSVFIVIMSLVQVLSGKLGDKFGRKPVFVFGAFILVFYPVSMVPAIVTGNWIWLIAANAFAGFGTGSFFVSLNALTLDLAPNDLMGAYSGIREMVFGIATFGGSLAAGFIKDALELSYGLYNTVLWMAIGITVLRFLASIGFLFVTESLPKDVREAREKARLKSKMKFE